MLRNCLILSLVLMLASSLAAIDSKTGFIPLTLEGVIKDDVRIAPFMNKNEKSLRTIIKLIEKADRDKSVKGIVLKLKSPRVGLAKLSELRSAFKSFKAKGKKIYVFSESLTKSDYYLASVANKIYLSPQGGLDISGIALELMFLRKTFNLLGVSPNFHQVGNYKSASEMFTRTGSSKYQRDSINFLLDGIFNEFITGASAGRGISLSRMKKLVDQGIFTTEEARKSGLIDGVAYEDQFQAIIEKNGGILSQYRPKPKMPKKKLSFFEVLSLLSKKPVQSSSVPKIAIIYMEGTIISGRSAKSIFGGDESIGSEDFAAILKKVRNDKLVKGVVLRINSPGGSALASDILWREISLLATAKPVIASMSDMAASGGYYLSMACPTIVANPLTITGSIGVVGGKFNIKGLYNKLGIKKEIFKRGKHADLFTDYRDFSPMEAKLIAKQMLETYKVFVTKAAQGRRLSYAKMHQLAQGKVYTGTQAVKVGLVDHLGGLDKAIQLMSKKLGKKNLEIVSYPEAKSFMDLLGSNLMLKSQLKKEMEEISSFVAPILVYLKNVQKVFAREHVATLTPFYVQVK